MHPVRTAKAVRGTVVLNVLHQPALVRWARTTLAQRRAVVEVVAATAANGSYDLSFAEGECHGGLKALHLGEVKIEHHPLPGVTSVAE